MADERKSVHLAKTMNPRLGDLQNENDILLFFAPLDIDYLMSFKERIKKRIFILPLKNDVIEKKKLGYAV